MIVFPTETLPPRWTQSPLTFEAEHSEAVPWGAGTLPSHGGCSARHSCLPAHLPTFTARERGSQPATVITGSHCPIPGFLGWAADTSLSLIRCFTPWNQPGSSWRVRGAGAERSLFTQSSADPRQGKPICLSYQHFPLHQMQDLTWSTAQKGNHLIRFNSLLLIMTPILWPHYSFVTHTLNFFFFLA